MADERIQGMAVALAEIIRLHQCEVEVADVLRGFGLGRSDLRAAGVAAEDLKALEPSLDMQAY